MLLPTFLVMAMPALAEPVVDFDQGKVDAGATVRAVRAAAKVYKASRPPVTEEPKAGLMRVLTPEAFTERVRDPQSVHVGSGFCRTDNDCVEWTFEPADKDSEPVWLRSTSYREECRYDPRGARDCWCRPDFTTRVKAQVRIPNRKAVFPWEREVFRICLEDRWLYYDEIALAWEYDSHFIKNTGIVEAEPKRKVAMNPDPEGIRVESFALDAAARNYTLVLADKWAASYKGEQTVLKLALKKKAFLGSSTVFQTELRLAPADRYTVRFADYAAQFKQPLEAGEKYFVDWSFQRAGPISKDKVVDPDDTEKVEFPKGASAASR